MSTLKFDEKEIELAFKWELQLAYGRMLDKLGIQYGDIEPGQLMALEEAEDKLVPIVTSWLMSSEEKEDE